MSLNVNTVGAEEKVFFMFIPSNVSVGEAVDAVTQAAINRGWLIEEGNNKNLRIRLDHRRYRAVLNFSFSDSTISYSDLTTRFNENFSNSRGNSTGAADWSSREEWQKSTAPQRWISYLKKDTVKFIASNKRSGNINNHPSSKSIEEKLGHLKKMYENGLITESEYKLKKTELLSKY
jgi:hypothetical protein